MMLEMNDLTTSVLAPQEVAEQMLNSTLDANEAIGAVEIYNDELIVTIRQMIEGDPRCSDYDSRTEVVTIADIRRTFTYGDYYAWAKDEDGNAVLVCLN